MVRPARPSDVFSASRQPPAPAPPPRPSAPHQPRRLPPWLTVVLVAGMGLIVVAVARLTGGGDSTAAPTVRVASVQQATAALAIYQAEAQAVAALRQRAAVFADPGPGVAQIAAAEGQRAVQAAVSSARALPQPDPLAASYWNDAGHAALLDRLAQARRDAELLTLLDMAHDGLFSGGGLVLPKRTAQELTSRLRSGNRPAPLAAWGEALLGQIDERDRAADTARWRAASQRYWLETVRPLEPAATGLLRRYLDGLPAHVLAAIRDDPDASPVLRRLEHDRRVIAAVSVATAAARPAR